MRRLIQYFQQMGWLPLVITLGGVLVLFGALVYRGFQSQSSQAIGLSQGYFCIPDMSDGKNKFVLKSFHLIPLFASRCENGRIELDSDLDGLCDLDEAKYKTSPQNRFSMHPAISDRIWVGLSRESKRKIKKMGDTCDPTDQDGDLLTNCEEIFLQSKRYEASNSEQTESLYNFVSLNINDPDTDGDGFIDGVEVRLVNNIAPFVFSNEESGVAEAENLLNYWQDSSKEQSIEIVINTSSPKEDCFSYQVLGLNTWLPQLQAFKGLVEQKEIIKLDFLVYTLLSSEQNPAESQYYATKILSGELNGLQLVDSPVINGFKFVKIQKETQ